jgi:hypothetical protein
MRLEDRPHLQSLLSNLKRLDSNGWCCVTDGSCDDLNDDDAADIIMSAINHISENN